MSVAFLFPGQGSQVPDMLHTLPEGIAQHYTLPRIALANVVLDPSLPVAA
jgi:malonyl CoA-acyl carrier protein transacylase